MNDTDTKPFPTPIAIGALVVFLIIIGAYAYVVRQPATTEDLASTQPVTEFVGTITAKDNDTITVARLVPPTGNEIAPARTVSEKVKITKTTVLSLLTLKDKTVLRNEIETSLREASSSPVTGNLDAFEPAYPFIESLTTFDRFVVGSKVRVETKEDARVENNLTAVQMKLFPEAFVIDPFNNPPIPKQNE